MNKIIKIFLSLLIIPPLNYPQNYLIIQSQNSIFVPRSSQICSDYIILSEGASFLTEDSSGTCNNTILNKLGKPAFNVNLISFESGTNSNNVMLTWETASRNTAFGFNVERFNPDKLIFEKIGFISADRTPNLKNSYSFTDRSSRLDTDYSYRLIQVNNYNSSLILKIIKVEASVPDQYFLSQNYPNPFNPSTKINYRIPERAHVLLKIYDVLGNDVSVLVNEDKPAGTYEVFFDALELSSGIYFYKLQTKNFTKTKKMILLR